jgi:hypothetical protein
VHVLSRAMLGLALLAGLQEPTFAEPHLQLGPVLIGLGAHEAAIVPELQKHFAVRAIEGGWSVQPHPRNPRAPGVGIATKAGRVERVSFLWGPGVTPPLEEMAQQLSLALQPDATCRIRNVTRPQEGGIVRTLALVCGGYVVTLVTGVWPQGNTASITVEAK